MRATRHSSQRHRHRWTFHLRWAAAAAIVWLMGGSHAVAQIRTFRELPNGDWETTLTDRAGRTRPFVFVTGNKLTVSTAVAVTIQDGDRGVVTYRYTILNSAGSEQSIKMIGIDPGRRDPVEVVMLETVPGWYPTPRGTFSLDDAGIPSGETVNIVLEGPALPGVINLQLSGSPAEQPIPGGLTERQAYELEDLSVRLSALQTAAIGPAIAIRGATVQVLLERVLEHYRLQFSKAKHPQLTALSRVRAGATEAAARAAAVQLREIAARPVANPWAQALSQALGWCADVVTAYKPRPPQ